MRAAVIPEQNGRWEIRDVPTPRPGVNEVLIRVRASGLCFSDVHLTRGMFPAVFPCTPGHEPAGEITAIGEGVTTRQVGDRVGAPWIQSTCGRCEWCARGRAMFCREQVGTGLHTPGAHAEYMIARAEATVLLPDELSFEQAAPIFCAGYTVWGGLRYGDPKPGERIAVLGIGGLGHLAVQYARAAGFETIAITHSPDKVMLARELGADEVVDSGKALARMGGADVILATSNSYAATSEAMKGLRKDGRIVVMGVSDEPLVLGAPVVFNRARVIGSIQNGPEYLYEALQIAARGGVRVRSEEYPLDDVAEAYDRLVDGRVRFRAVLVDES